ncbi:unnamed protein product [Bursaphelenchus xylophilus]|uniref:(pine wood nematode) hypothetical protein n=1 Tax=Bursaphelenchus xylophilus TaxID=6326 RepID=A0A1I7SG50_BURXY|nr:unnamed protein product [Bursaphelenchus xylophilus]CAG9131878.1 unnamed protein product [Bursaphelenchus xylophilus]
MSNQWLLVCVMGVVGVCTVQAAFFRGQPWKELFIADDSRADKRSVAYLPTLDEFSSYGSYYYNSPDEVDGYRQAKRDDQAMPGVLRFGKRADIDKKEMPGVLRFGKRSDGEAEKKAVPGVLRFGKRSDMPGVLRFGKRDGAEMPGVLRFGKKSEMPGVLRFGKRSDMPGVLRFGKRGDMPGVLRFGRK